MNLTVDSELFMGISEMDTWIRSKLLEGKLNRKVITGLKKPSIRGGLNQSFFSHI